MSGASATMRSPNFGCTRSDFVFPGFSSVPALTTAGERRHPLILQKKDWDEALKEAAADLEIVGLKDKTQRRGQFEWRRTAAGGDRPGHPSAARHFDSRRATASLDGDTGRNM